MAATVLVVAHGASGGGKLWRAEGGWWSFFSRCFPRPLFPLSLLFFLLLCFVLVSPLLLLVAAIVGGGTGGGGIVFAAMRQASDVCCSLFSSFSCRGASLCFSVISVFFFPHLYVSSSIFLTMMVLLRVTGRDDGN